MTEFIGFPKIPRLSREIIITEKLDGTNGQIYFPEDNGPMLVGSRKRWITQDNDNFGFAAWCFEHEEELRSGLGIGRHYGEWWGRGINRAYGLTGRRFSLFNVSKWVETRPSCCDVVPVILKGEFTTENVELALSCLAATGSIAAPGFMRPEGIVIYHTAGHVVFKKTLENDEKPKGVDE